MPTIRLFRALVAQQDIQAVYNAAVNNGNWKPASVLPRDRDILTKLYEANRELADAQEEARKYVEAKTPEQRENILRIAGERDIARFLLSSLLAQDYEISIDDGEERSSWTRNMKQILDTVLNVDEAWVHVRRERNGGQEGGYAYLLFGNSPEELIADYTLGAEEALTPTFKYIRDFYDSTFIIPNE